MSESETDESQSFSNNCSSAESEQDSEVNSDCGAVLIGAAITTPYEDEPILHGENMDKSEEEVDIDGILLHVLESRFEKETPLNEWCSCTKCDYSLLNGAREYRCCSEVHEAIGKLCFDGSIERIKCITQHEDYQSMTQTVVLEHVGPLLKDKQGRSYKQKKDQGKNGYLRAVAYRWVIRYIFGYLGWDNSRPLPACVYHDIRKRFPTGWSKGYASALERQ